MSKGEPSPRMGFVTIAALFIAAAQPPLGSTLIAVALPSIGLGIEADLVLITGLLVTGYLVVYVVCQGPAGKISDMLGHARVLWSGLFLYIIGAAIGLIAQDVGLLFLSRSLMAAAGAIIVPSTLALLRIHIPEARRGRVLGLFGAAQGIAAAFGPALGGEIVSLFGWRAVFFANLPFLAIAAILLVLFPVPASPRREGPPAESTLHALDLPGIGLLALALICVIAAASLRGVPLIGVVIAGCLAAIAFVMWELRARAPAFELSHLRHPTFRAGAVILALQNFAMYGLLFQLPQFFTVFLEAGTRDIGYLLFLLMVGMFVAAPLGGYLSDRFGARSAAFLAAAVLLAGLAQLWQLENFTAPFDAATALLVFGLGLGLGNAPAQTAALGAVSADKAGSAAAISSMMRHMGGILSMLALGWVLVGDDSVSVSRHLTMVHLYSLAITGCLLVSLRLPGRAR